MATKRRCVFITGGTGYMGQRLIPRLLARGHEVRALVRPGSEKKLPNGCTPIEGDALEGSTYADQISPADTFVQLVGVAYPSPAKAAEFRRIDRPAGLSAVQAAKSAGIRHFIYVSVAHPAPTMQAYIAVRIECEEAIESAGLDATILRPWYVLGPGHRWPYLVLPVYKLAELLPRTREGARRLGLVTLEQMLNALTFAVENPVEGRRVFSVREIRSLCALKAAPIKAFRIVTLAQTKVMIRITKAHARGTSTRSRLPMRCLTGEREWLAKTWKIFI